MKLFRADFDGIYLSGHAIICADDEAGARFILQSMSEKTIGGRIPGLELVELQTDKPSVLYFDDGDY